MTFQQTADCLARSYDPYARFTSEAIGSALDVLHRACKRPPASVLDLGQGPACPPPCWRSGWPAARFVLLDFSVPMLRQARRRFQAETSPPHEVAADAARLPFPASAFDLVFSSCMVTLSPTKRPCCAKRPALPVPEVWSGWCSVNAPIWRRKSSTGSSPDSTTWRLRIIWRWPSWDQP